MSDDRRYKDDEVRAIIDRALRAQPGELVNHADLLAIGAGVGLAPETIEQASRELQQAQRTAQATARVVARRRRGLAVHGLVFLVLNSLLFLINFLTTPGEWWVLFSVFGWVPGLLLHVAFALATVSPRRLERELRRMDKVAPKARVAAPASAARAGLRVEEAAPALDDPRESDPAEAQARRRE